ncbi:MAG: exodeoxyribonuclease III [Planctomycetota bacterium]|nr:exodeoxyribonuclease III [Planctomycetota bacterium]
MKVISWNVNSIRTRLERVLGVLERHQPDLLCLQETKVTDEDFPHTALANAGWHAHVHGQKTYNGVAMISREPLEEVVCNFDDNPVPEEARIIRATCQGVRVLNAYVINGKEVGCDKYVRKLAWLDALTQTMKAELAEPRPTVMLGDFNIVTDDRDIYDADGWRGKILCSDEERARLQSFLSLGMVDLHREQTSEAGIFTWWDYRGGAFPRNMGMRIDLALGNPSAAGICTDVGVDRDERKKGDWEAKPSDHAPLVVVLKTS